MSGFFESLTGLVLRNPWWLVPVALSIPAFWWLHRGPRVAEFGPAPLLFTAADGTPRPLPATWRTRLLPLPRLLLGIGLCLVLLALARPVHRVRLPHTDLGIDIFLCLDTSSSMAERDMDPARTRLDLAVEAAARFIGDRKSDRIGIITFARFPDLRCPPTLDHRALLGFLDAVTLVEHEGPEDQTGIGHAVARAAQALRSSDARSKVIILLTDGEENVATAQNPEEIGPLHAARLCERFGVKVYTIAAGTAAPGQPPPDTRQVQQLASMTGGRFFRARERTAIAQVYDAIDSLERAPREDPRYELEERFLPFLLAALLCLGLGRALATSALEVLP